MVYVIVEGLNPSRRVRLLDGSLTPVFEYASQAFRYCEGKGIFHCSILKK